MIIETDANVGMGKPPAEMRLSGKTQLGGLSGGKEIYIAVPADSIELIRRIVHEVGHNLGDRLSFKGKNRVVVTPPFFSGEACYVVDKLVMSPDEANRPETTIVLTPEEKRFLAEHVHSSQSAELTPLVLAIAGKLITRFSNENYDSKYFKIKPVTPEQLMELARKGKSDTHIAGPNSTIVMQNTRGARNVELSATYVELICLQILENTLREYAIYNPDAEIRITATDSPSHQRARNLVNWAFRKKKQLPSVKDIIHRRRQHR